MQRRKIFLPFFFLWQLADDKIPACKDVKLLFAGHIARHLLTFLLEGGSSLELVLAWLRNTSQSAHAPFRSSSLSMMGCTTLSPEAGDYQPLPSSQVESRGFQTCCFPNMMGCHSLAVHKLEQAERNIFPKWRVTWSSILGFSQLNLAHRHSQPQLEQTLKHTME